ncbi:MAG: thioredoxin domain-containing protein [Campylobacterota bacterium]|nr:thioredoxin domain-containing protein [Campylobacterota bacterium]
MLSMLKLSLTILLLSSTLFASTPENDLKEFLEKKFKNNPKIISLKVDIVDKNIIKEIEVKDKKNSWYAYVIKVHATVKNNDKKNQTLTQKMIWFSNGTIITPEFIDMDTGDSLKDDFPSFEDSYYKAENLIYGNKNAKHKVAIFSDPLCPFCRSFIPKAIKEMKKQPNKFAIYYYHFPLPRLHPSAVELSYAAIAAELQGKKDVVLNLYKVKVNAHEKDVKKILKAFNKTVGTNITEDDIKSLKVKEQYEFDQKVAEAVMVAGTPTIFFDGKLDKSKKKYQKVK